MEYTEPTRPRTESSVTDCIIVWVSVMNPACAAPMKAAAASAMGMFTESARTAGARPLMTPRFRNIRPRRASPDMPAMAMTVIIAPSPTAVINRLIPASPSPSRVSETSGSSDSNDIVSPQWKSAMNTIALSIGCR